MIRIERSAEGPGRAWAAEVLYAAQCAAQGWAPVLRGGRTKGHDIVACGRLIDVKTLAPMTTSELRSPDPDGIPYGVRCTYKFARHGHRLFNPNRTTHLGFVLMPQDLRIQTAIDAGAVVTSVPSAGVRIYRPAGVEDVNAVLDPLQFASKRYVYLPDDLLSCW